MDKMKTVKLMTCNDAAQAHIIQGALENEGIASLLHNENMSTLLRGYVQDIAGVDVLIDQADYDAAVGLLERNQMIPEQLKYCPFCGSSDIKFGLKKGLRVRAFLSAIASMLAIAPPGHNHWEYVCRSCGEKFEKPVAAVHAEQPKEEQESERYE